MAAESKIVWGLDFGVLNTALSVTLSTKGAAVKPLALVLFDSAGAIADTKSAAASKVAGRKKAAVGLKKSSAKRRAGKPPAPRAVLPHMVAFLKKWMVLFPANVVVMEQQVGRAHRNVELQRIAETFFETAHKDVCVKTLNSRTKFNTPITEAVPSYPCATNAFLKSAQHKQAAVDRARALLHGHAELLVQFMAFAKRDDVADALCQTYHEHCARGGAP